MDGLPVALTPALIVEDEPATQRRLAELLTEVAGASIDIVFAGSLAEARARLDDLDFALALVDIGLPDGDGRELIAWLHAERPHTTSVVISAWGQDQTVLAALRAGATGYLLKERDDVELAVSLRSVARGGAPIDPALARGILALVTAPASGSRPSGEDRPGAPSLSAREMEVLTLVARGYSNREIAGLVGLSPLTVEGYCKSIYRKLAVGSRTAAVHEARQLGLLQ
ncbi:response regulator transcription factor [Arenimonas composti]|uniref:LuxR family transcriptional regulator n=1 Tax=Arenimonas composti TR7-09 = DSM 18010 TaxID=1121013 RepID=A0A091B850_9GAMM|nr:response regulator transcription factor [Arenimonas composti]KFN48833.1 hypothetical protein P873_13555 [Arenimonas composti TR7-09 = DSM 18010]